MKRKQSINSIYRKQQNQINRIQKQVEKWERQGFTVSRQLKNMLKTSGKSTKSAQEKYNRLKSIKAKDVAKKLTSYTTDQGKTLKGKKGVKEGKRRERKKQREAKQEKISCINNIDDDVNNAVDYVVYDENGNHVPHCSEISVSDLKSKLIFTWNDYKMTTRISDMNMTMLSELHEALQPLYTISQQRDEYDNHIQNAIMIIDNGTPVDPDDIDNDESMESET